MLGTLPSAITNCLTSAIFSSFENKIQFPLSFVTFVILSPSCLSAPAATASSEIVLSSPQRCIEYPGDINPTDFPLGILIRLPLTSLIAQSPTG